MRLSSKNARWYSKKETFLKYYKLTAFPTLLYGSESGCWILTKQQESRTETDEMRFLRTVVGNRRTDHIRNRATRQELNICDMQDKIVKYQTNWFQHVERMDESIGKYLYKIGCKR